MTKQVQGPTREHKQEQKETEPKTSNHKGPKSFLETEPETNLKMRALTTEFKGPGLGLSGLLAHGQGYGWRLQVRLVRVIKAC